MLIHLLVLNGKRKDEVIYAQNNFIFAGSYFNDPEMADSHAKIVFDSDFNWNIKCLGWSKLRAGCDEQLKAMLIPGFIFHLGQTGFRVVERSLNSTTSWETSTISYLQLTDWQPVQNDFKIFKQPLRLTITQGFQLNTSFTIAYGPRTLGFDNPDLSLKDASLPKIALRFFEDNEKAYINDLTNGFLRVNGKEFQTHLLLSGDQIQIGSNLVEVSFLNLE